MEAETSDTDDGAETSDLRTLDHDRVTRELKQALIEYVDTRDEPSSSETCVRRERQKQKWVGSRQLDVCLDDPNPDDWWLGCAFEVKTRGRSYAWLKATGQLADYLAMGYRPILVAPRWFFLEGHNGSPSTYSFLNVISRINAAVLEIISADPLHFQPYSGSPSQFTAPELSEFFYQKCVDAGVDRETPYVHRRRFHIE